MKLLNDSVKIHCKAHLLLYGLTSRSHHVFEWFSLKNRCQHSSPAIHRIACGRNQQLVKKQCLRNRVGTCEMQPAQHSLAIVPFQGNQLHLPKLIRLVVFAAQVAPIFCASVALGMSILRFIFENGLHVAEFLDFHRSWWLK